MNDLSDPSLEEALSSERFEKYLSWAAGDRERAIALYTLNTQLSECLYTPLQMLEVGLRNRIHSVMSEAFGEEWFDLPAYQVNPRQAEMIEKARRDLTEERKEHAPGRMVAALTFGYWTAMLGKEYEDLWQAKLRRIGQRENAKGLQRKEFARPLTPIRALRNRIAHHEPILTWNLPQRYASMVQLTEWLSPAAAAWTRKHCRFEEVYPPGGVNLEGEVPPIRGGAARFDDPQGGKIA